MALIIPLGTGAAKPADTDKLPELDPKPGCIGSTVVRTVLTNVGVTPEIATA